MNGLTIDRFDDYFTALHGHPSYSWQRRLAGRAVNGGWPCAIDLPTGSGKTACIDIAIFALACQASRPVQDRAAPRRVFFCVNRRVIVDEAYQRARRIAKKIGNAERDAAQGEPVLREVAVALRIVAGTTADHDVPPLDVLELRGGIYRDNRWARSATQPTVICTTLDQLGSRLLFRGYGVSSNAAPIQAALIAYDSLILLDEAHISEPFRQTLGYVGRYLDPEKWAERVIGVRPVVVVPMTATLPTGVSADDVIRLDEADRDPAQRLLRRLTASKSATLPEPVKDVATEAVKLAGKLAKERPTAVGIIVNRVATAKQIYEELKGKHDKAVVELVIGSMRPLDRDDQAERLRQLIGPDRPPITEATSFVVATQCLEVGADYDFDALVTECASLDALRQRFGRLNRAGRPIDAKAVIVAAKDAIKPDDKLDQDKPLDPIYGNAMARTWNWLHAHATGEEIDFGIDAFNALLDQHGDGGRIPGELLAPSALLDGPVMLPAYLDFWCQTAPRPLPDPDVSLFIHGPQRGEPDVQVCWRADLGEGDGYPEAKQWCDVVALLPPTAAECMSVPISRLRRWLAGDESGTTDHGDLLGIGEEEPADDKKSKKGGREGRERVPQRRGVLWRGVRESIELRTPEDLRPGDTLVLPVAAGGWKELGHVPGDAAQIDLAESAYLAARLRAALRIHPKLWPGVEAFNTLFHRLDDPDDRPTIDLRELLRAATDEIPDGDVRRKSLRCLAGPASFLVEDYPDGRGVVLRSRRRIKRDALGSLPALDDGEDAGSRTSRKVPVSLPGHTRHVVEAVENALATLPDEPLAEAFRTAAQLHDLGKADERFQAMLRRTDRTDAWLLAGLESALLAKSDGQPMNPVQHKAARERAGLLEGFRHELLSVQLAERSGFLPEDAALRELVLHLIAAHHGHARPFAPVVLDPEPPEVTVEGVTITASERTACPPHRLDSGIAERFWSLTRRYGWWGLAYLEAVLRLADQQASAAEDAGEYEDADTTETAETQA